MEDHWRSLDEVWPKQKEGRHRSHAKHHQRRGNRRNESWTMDPRGGAICHSYPSNLGSSFPWLRQVLWIKTGPLVVRFVSFTLLCHSDCISRSRHWGCEWNPGFCDLNYIVLEGKSTPGNLPSCALWWFHLVLPAPLNYTSIRAETTTMEATEATTTRAAVSMSKFSGLMSLRSNPRGLRKTKKI